MSTELAKHESGTALAQQDELTVEQVVAQVQKIQEVQRAVMKEDEHFGVIPGTQKPTLYKPGAEKLCETFRLAPRYPTVERTGSPEGHLDVFVRCELTHIPSGLFYGEGLGACTSREAKYAYRQSERVCPTCGKPAIIKGKAEYGGGWLCFKKKDGCGAKFADDDEAIISQQVGRVANEDLPDTWNTIVKMAKKRALVDAVLTATAASDIFTQDIEDTSAEPKPPEPKRTTVIEEPLATKPQIRKLEEALDKVVLNSDVERDALDARLRERYATDDLSKLTRPQADELLERLGGGEA